MPRSELAFKIVSAPGMVLHTLIPVLGKITQQGCHGFELHCKNLSQNTIKIIKKRYKEYSR